MYIDRDNIEEYPFNGEFYTYTIDESKPLEERVEEEVVVLNTKCDIQESSKKLSGTLTANFAIYFPFEKSIGIDIKRGMFFRGNLYGLVVNGEIKSIVPTQMGGCVAYIVDKDV